MKKIALVTGASAGIGRELARCHAAAGGDLIILARRRDKLEELKTRLEQEFSAGVHVIAADLTRPEAPREVYDRVRSLGPAPDYLINNAGFGGRGKFHERPLEKDLAMIALNISALTALTRLFLPDMTARKSGRILNVSSTAGLMPGPLQAVYYASKAYVSSFSSALGEELRHTGVTVTALLPGATESEFGRVSGMEGSPLFRRTAPAREVARKGYRGMLRGRRDVIAGVPPLLRLSLALLPLLPKGAVLRSVRKMQEL